MAGQGGTAPIVGVDLGGTKILVAVVGPDNAILGRSKRSTPAESGASAILAAMVDGIDQAIAEAHITREDIAGIGIGSPGPLDTKTGVILETSNLNVKDWPIGPELAREIGRPTLLLNDVRVGAYGEFRLGAGRGFRDILAAFVGTGIGGCVIIDGKVVEGATGNAGEVGHIMVKANGPMCSCGRRGCLEALSSRSAITRRISKAAKNGEESVLIHKVDKKSGRLKSGDIAAALAAGDAVTDREVRRAAHYLGLGLGGVVNLLGPEIVIIGGGVVAALGPKFIDLIRIAARTQILVDPHGKIRIEPAALGDDAGILGAALLAREKFAPETGELTGG
jgi:glucokinase